MARRKYSRSLCSLVYLGQAHGSKNVKSERVRDFGLYYTMYFRTVLVNLEIGVSYCNLLIVQKVLSPHRM
jgi:hypothetical protein